MLFRKKKIPCYVLIFEQVDIIKRSLEFLAKSSDKIDLIIIENPSQNTPEITKIVDKYGAAGQVKRYYLFDENITGNAYDVVLNQELASIRKSPFVLITDGDLTCKDTSWLDEELGVLKNHREVFAIGVTLDMSNLPLATFPSAKDFIPPIKQEYPDFNEGPTGGHLLMFRGAEFANFMDWKNKNKLFFVDSEMHRYCLDNLNKKWARTKKAIAYHLTWDLYADKSHPYTKLKTKKTFSETWHHHRKAPFTLKEY